MPTSTDFDPPSTQLRCCGPKDRTDQTKESYRRTSDGGGDQNDKRRTLKISGSASKPRKDQAEVNRLTREVATEEGLFHEPAHHELQSGRKAHLKPDGYLATSPPRRGPDRPASQAIIDVASRGPEGFSPIRKITGTSSRLSRDVGSRVSPGWLGLTNGDGRGRSNTALSVVCCGHSSSWLSDCAELAAVRLGPSWIVRECFDAEPPRTTRSGSLG